MVELGLSPLAMKWGVFLTAVVDAGMVNFRRELSSWPIENFMLVDLHGTVPCQVDTLNNEN